MFFLLIAFVVGICLEIGLLYFSTDLWSAPHRLCLSLIPSSPMNPHLAAMICGAPLPPPAAKVWILSSLIHVFVVSGAHLVLIATVLQKLRMPWGLCTLLLGIYTALCHFQPPVVRAFVHWLLSSS
ncbi:MAG: hypothetical protein N2578_05460, partial [Bdellovibrionaceae bacterium]|nr:hypothetical protein [Pseudobdellovibrionaceae bacterium]